MDYAVLPVLWLFTTPYFVWRLGPDSYGLWMLVNAFVGFSGVAGLGLGDAAVRFIAQYRVSGNAKGIARVVGLMLLMYGALGVIIPIVVYLSAPLLVSTIFSFAEEGAALAVEALRIGGVAMTFRLFDSIPTAILHGNERFDLQAKVRIPATIISMGLCVILVALGHSVAHLLTATALVLLVSALAKAVMAKRFLPKRLSFPGLFSSDDVREIKAFALHSWFQATGGVLLTQADRLLIASLVGTRTLTYYTVCIQFSQQIHSFFAQVLSFLLPMASGFQASGNIGRLRRTFFTATNIVTIAAVGIGIPAFLLSHEILSVWIDPSFANEASGLLSSFVVVFTLLSTSIVPHYMMNAMGFYRLNTVLSLSAGSVVSAATLWLVPVLGVLGAPVARFLSLPISIIGRTVIHFRAIDDKRWSAGLMIFFPLLVLFASLFMLRESAVLGGLTPWAKALVVGGISLLGTGMVALFLFTLNREQRIRSSQPGAVPG